ncbi:MAG: SRPBCC family protein [Acidobacteria bacterium]|nr:SRPBCC family protein [Acidobacteriota bacterium]
MPQLVPQDLSYLETAKQRLDFSHVVQASPERVFAVLADGASWPRWFVDFKRAEQTSPGPLGLGGTRHVWVGPLNLEERFIAWEPGRRFSFTMLTINLPLVTSLLEDWRLTPEGSGTRVDYAVRFDVPWWLRPFTKLLLLKFRPMFRKALPNLETYLRNNP